MKAKGFCLFLAVVMCMTVSALADGNWVYSELHGDIQLAMYAEIGYEGYIDTNSYGPAGDSAYQVTVISKSASVWQEPRTNSKKLGSASHGETLECRLQEGRYVAFENGFYGVTYKGREGWINQDYVINNELVITLLESNVPAYIAPDASAKKVGSLSKFTEYRVIGFYDDYYIVNLRGAAAAYIPMSVRHRDNEFDSYYQNGGTLDLKVNTESRVTLRTGPDASYPEVRKVKAGTQLTVMDVIDGWFMVWDTENDQYAFVAPDELVVESVWESVG